MMDVVTGKTKPDLGQVVFGEGVDLLQMDSQMTPQIGIGRKFQSQQFFKKSYSF